MPVLNPLAEVVAALALVWSPERHQGVALAPLRVSLASAREAIEARLAQTQPAKNPKGDTLRGAKAAASDPS
jgi:hypothetical protein